MNMSWLDVYKNVVRNLDTWLEVKMERKLTKRDMYYAQAHVLEAKIEDGKLYVMLKSENVRDFLALNPRIRGYIARKLIKGVDPEVKSVMFLTDPTV